MTLQFPEKRRKRKFSLRINTVDKTQSWVLGKLAGDSLHLGCLAAPFRYLQGNTGPSFARECQKGFLQQTLCRRELSRGDLVQGPEALKSLEKMLKMFNLRPYPRLLNSNQLLTISPDNFYLYTSWRHILEIRQFLHF